MPDDYAYLEGAPYAVLPEFPFPILAVESCSFDLLLWGKACGSVREGRAMTFVTYRLTPDQAEEAMRQILKRARARIKETR